MRISLTDEDGAEYDYDFDQEEIILGRGARSDIVIQSDHISRKHLSISLKEGVIYIKDLTLSNWVSYNDEKLVKNTEIQYFDFAPLVLPGGIKLKISDNLQPQEDFSVSKTIQGFTAGSKESEKVDIYNTKLSSDLIRDGQKKQRQRDRQQARDERKEQKTKELKIMTIAFLILLAGIVGFYYDDITGQSSQQVIVQPKKKKKKIRKRVTKKKKKPALKAPTPVKQEKVITQFEKDFTAFEKDKGKCKAGTYKTLCTMIFGQLVPPEGILIRNGVVHIIKNYRLRLEKTYKNDGKKINKAMGSEGIKEYIALQNVLNKQILKQIEKTQVNKIKIYVFYSESSGNRLMTAYEIEPGIYRRFSDSDWQFANKQVLENVDLKYFNSKFVRYLQEGYRLK